MTFTLIQHQWKAFWRSKNTGQSIIVQVVLGIIVLYFLLNLLAISFFLDKILLELFPGKNVVSSFSGFLLYYFFLDLLLRYQLPCHRKSLVNRDVATPG